jgi:uncharacterized alkaline shock family protein YloU
VAETVSAGDSVTTAAATAGPGLRPAAAVTDGGAGRTTVEERAVERIVVRLLADFAHVGGAGRRFLGVGIGDASDAQVGVRLHGQSATSLAVRCSVRYPIPVAQATEAVRGELRRRIPELTGLAVRRVDITVTSLSIDNGARVR